MSQQRLFDGEPVEKFSARLGTVEIEPEDNAEMRVDRPVVMVVVGVPTGASFSRTKNGEWRRSNAVQVESLVVATGEARRELIETFNLAAGSEALFELSMRQEGGRTDEVPERQPEASPEEISTDDIPGVTSEPDADDGGYDDGAFDPDDPGQLGEIDELQAPRANGSAVADKASLPQLEDPIPDQPPIPVHRSRDAALARFMEDG